MVANVLLQSALSGISAYTEQDIHAAMEALSQENIQLSTSGANIILNVPSLSLLVIGSNIEEAAKNLLREYLYQIKPLK